jgi:hypothetical protein
VAGDEVKHSTYDQSGPSGSERDRRPGDSLLKGFGGFLDDWGVNDFAEVAAGGAQVALYAAHSIFEIEFG